MRAERGFTLVEVLVALSIFALLSAAGLSVLNSTLATRDQVAVRQDQLHDLMIARALLRADLAQAIPRSVKTATGQKELETFRGDGQPDEGRVFLAFTRLGASPAELGLPGSAVQHVSYLLSDGHLVRRVRIYSDGTTGTPVVERVLLEDITSLSLRFRGGPGWVSQWVARSEEAGGVGIPQSVALSLTLEPFGTIEQIFLMTGEGA